MQKIVTTLMFVGRQAGNAEKAMAFYVTLFKDSRILKLERYGPGEDETEGTLKVGSFTLDGQMFNALDSGRDHQFTFTPAISLTVNCETKEEIDLLWQMLSEGATIYMPLAQYPFSKRFGWISDKFGVTWQLMLQDRTP